MDALLTTILAVGLAEMGDRQQILCAALAMRFASERALLAGLALAALANSLISALAGAAVSGWIADRPLQLFYALSLLFAAAGMLAWRRRVDLLETWRVGAFLTAFVGLFVLGFGNKAQFILAATAARTDAWPLALAGGWIGTMIACAPAVILRERLAQLVPLPAIRRTGGILFLFIGAALALNAWGLWG